MPLLERPDSTRISWEADGPEDGPPVLLIMGLGYPAAMWFRQLPALTERYRVIRLDNRGAGHTGDVPGAPYTVETMAADCLAVLDAAGAESAHVVGISMGGLMAQEIGCALVPGEDAVVAVHGTQTFAQAQCPADAPHVVGGALSTNYAGTVQGNTGVAAMQPLTITNPFDGWRSWMDNYNAIDMNLFAAAICVPSI